MDRQEALELLAVAKFFRELSSTAERQAKAALADHIHPGGRDPVVIDGAEVATVSRDRVTEKDTLVITDEVALIAWLDRHEEGEGVIRTVAEWKRADLEATVLNAGGELPDGTDIVTKQGGGTIRTRQSPEQASALAARPTLLAGMLPALTSKESK